MLYFIHVHLLPFAFQNRKYVCVKISLTLFDMGFFEPSVHGGGGGHNFVVIARMIMKFGTGIKFDVFYTTVTKVCDVTTIM